MYFLIISCLLLGIASAKNQTDAEVVNTTTATSPLANQEPFETFLLNSYNYDNPLIIRSRIPESSQPQDIIKHQAKTAQETSPNTVPSQYPVPLPYFNIQQSDKIEVLPTVSIPTISDLSALLYADSPYSVGLTSFESNFPTYYQATKLLDPVPILPVLTPAQLQFSNSWNPGSTEAPLAKDSLATSLTTDSNSQRNFLIQKIPEVASFTKSGQFSISDIPELTELEAIFTNSTTAVSVIESRSGTDLDNVDAATNTTLEDEHIDSVETTTSVQSNIELQSAVITDINSNKIENDEEEKLDESINAAEDDNRLKGNVSIWDLISGRDSTGQNEESVTINLDETTVAVTENIV